MRNVQVDLFFYREPEEAKEREEEEGAAPEFTPAEYNAPPIALAAEQWGTEGGDAGNWEPSVAAPVPAAVQTPAQDWSAGAGKCIRSC